MSFCCCSASNLYALLYAYSGAPDRRVRPTVTFGSPVGLIKLDHRAHRVGAKIRMRDVCKGLYLLAPISNSLLHPTVRLLRGSLRSPLAARPAGEQHVRRAEQSHPPQILPLRSTSPERDPNSSFILSGRRTCLLSTCRYCSFLMLLVALTTPACVVRDVALPPDYVLGEIEARYPLEFPAGVVFFSCALSGFDEIDTMGIFMELDDENVNKNYLSQLTPLLLSKRKATGTWGLAPKALQPPRGSDHLVALSMPSGTYRISRWLLGQRPGLGFEYRASKFHTFSVAKNKATYIGHLDVALAKDIRSFQLKIEDHFDEDRAKLKEYAAGIKDSEIIRGLVTSKPFP